MGVLRLDLTQWSCITRQLSPEAFKLAEAYNERLPRVFRIGAFPSCGSWKVHSVFFYLLLCHLKFFSFLCLLTTSLRDCSLFHSVKLPTLTNFPLLHRHDANRSRCSRRRPCRHLRGHVHLHVLVVPETLPEGCQDGYAGVGLCKKGERSRWRTCPSVHRASWRYQSATEGLYRTCYTLLDEI